MVADVSCQLLEVDYAAAESVVTGWFLRDPQYIRLSRLGIYAAVIAQKHHISLDWTAPDAVLAQQLKACKAEYPNDYAVCKRVVLGNAYGLTTFGMVEQMPDYFPTERVARETQEFYYALAPGLPAWHREVQQRAKKLGMLGGTTTPPSKWDHPYGYRAWFWDVLSYQPTDEYTARKWQRDPRYAGRIVYLHGRPFKTKLGSDAKAAIAYYPQSTVSGRLKEAELDLFLPGGPSFIGDCYFGLSPFLGPIHDALLLHVPTRCLERVLATVVHAMTRPSLHLPCPPEWGIGSHLSIGITAKVGRDWGQMEEIETPSASTLSSPDESLRTETVIVPRDEDSQEEWDALRRVV